MNLLGWRSIPTPTVTRARVDATKRPYRPSPATESYLRIDRILEPHAPPAHRRSIPATFFGERGFRGGLRERRRGFVGRLPHDALARAQHSARVLRREQGAGAARQRLLDHPTRARCGAPHRLSG